MVEPRYLEGQPSIVHCFFFKLTRRNSSCHQGWIAVTLLGSSTNDAVTTDGSLSLCLNPVLTRRTSCCHQGWIAVTLLGSSRTLAVTKDGSLSLCLDPVELLLSPRMDRCHFARIQYKRGETLAVTKDGSLSLWSQIFKKSRVLRAELFLAKFLPDFTAGFCQKGYRFSMAGISLEVIDKHNLIKFIT